MYGIVNKAIQDLIIENFGVNEWDAIRKHSGVEVDYFLSNEPYEDDITYKLIASASEFLGVSQEQIMHDFGEWWILRTSKEMYGSLLDVGGRNLEEFLKNLPLFHNRIMLIYPKLTPPEFQVSHLMHDSIHIHYMSKREGLTEFVRGLLMGLAKLYETDAVIELVSSERGETTKDIFKVSW